MKELNDENIQKLLEQGRLPKVDETTADQKEDLKVYQFLFNKLKQGPEVNLPKNFAAKVAANLATKKQSSDARQFYLLITFVLISFAAIAWYVVHQFSHEVVGRVNVIISPYKWILLFVGVILLAIQWADQKLVRTPRGMA